MAAAAICAFLLFVTAPAPAAEGGANEAAALARRGEAWRGEGHLAEAADDLLAAHLLAARLADPALTAATAAALGNLAVLARWTSLAPALSERLAQAGLCDATATARPSDQLATCGGALLRRGHEAARRLGDVGLVSATANDLGNLDAATGRAAPAREMYAESLRAADQSGDAAAAATAATNAARLALRQGDASAAAASLRTALDRLDRLPPDHATRLARVAAGTIAATADTAPPPAVAALQREALQQAAAAAPDGEIASLALGGLGRQEEQAGHLDAAAELTRAALGRAQQTAAPELLFRWNWQLARIERARGRTDDALAAYRRAVIAMETLRPAIPVEYRDGTSSFRTTFSPLYNGFADLLLQQARRLDRSAAAPLITEARTQVERLKPIELQDYFRDDCVTLFASRQRPLEQSGADTAILYPVLFDDRLELIVSVAGQDDRVAVPVPRRAVQEIVVQFRRALQDRARNGYLPPAQELYRLLIAPIEPVLAHHGVHTLVVVPDGVLRTIPFAALHDGTRFLVERYAVATEPGLTLVAARPRRVQAGATLVAGVAAGSGGYERLPYVADEVREVQRLRHGTALLDAGFTRARFLKELQDPAYSVVHIASHAEFSRDEGSNFVLAWNGRLNLDDLESSVRLARYREDGLELLMLSGCETGAGDDRAALGLAGLAVRSGARSVVATLWAINDAAAGYLVGRFYAALPDAPSKAVALQRAQQALIDDDLLWHPAFWAPFLLVGDWQ